MTHSHTQQSTPSTSPWTLRLGERSEVNETGMSLVRIICFHAAGCQPTVFVGWRRHFSANISVTPIVLPMHGSRLQETLPDSFQDIARNLVDECPNLFDCPTLLFGHSMGAMIAYEVACLLQLQNKKPLALVVSGAQSPNRREVVDRTIGITDSEFLNVLRAYGSISEELLGNKEFLDYYLPIARTDFALCERYKWQTQEALLIPIHTFNGVTDTHIKQDGVKEWGNFTYAGCTHHIFDGGHFYCDENPTEVCQKITEIAAKILSNLHCHTYQDAYQNTYQQSAQIAINY